MAEIDGKIVLIDEEKFEKSLLEMNLHTLGWDVQVEYFNNSEDALHYLMKTIDEVFLVICAMKLHDKSGMQLKKELDSTVKSQRKSVPFIFMSNSAEPEEVYNAFENIQGYFKKPYNIGAMVKMLDIIIRYWMLSKHPISAEKILKEDGWRKH